MVFDACLGSTLSEVATTCVRLFTSAVGEDKLPLRALGSARVRHSSLSEALGVNNDNNNNNNGKCFSNAMNASVIHVCLSVHVALQKYTI